MDIMGKYHRAIVPAVLLLAGLGGIVPSSAAACAGDRAGSIIAVAEEGAKSVSIKAEDNGEGISAKENDCADRPEQINTPYSPDSQMQEAGKGDEEVQEAGKHGKEANEIEQPGKDKQEGKMVYRMPKSGNFLRYTVENGDTVYIASIPPAYSFAINRKGKDWRKYYRLVHNFSKVYPYSLVAKRVVEKADSTFDAGRLSQRKKEKYVNNLQREIFTTYEKTARSLTISQGQLLMKLIDREVGKSPYYLIKDYKNGMAAGFWQGIAKMFGTDMKKHYDPQGEDKDTEDLIKKWETGEFPHLYFSIFGTYPTVPETPSNFR